MRRALFALGISMTLACSPKPSPTPPPGPTPSPSGSCCRVNSTDGGWVKDSKVDPYNALFLIDAEREVGSVCDRSPEESIPLLVMQLASTGVCAGPWSAGTLMVSRPDGLWEQWDVVSGGGCWRPLDPAAYIATWRGSSSGCK